MEFTKAITALKGATWYVVLAVFLSFSIYIFKEEFSLVIRKTTEHAFKDPVVDVIDKNRIIDSSLQEMMNHTSADRAYIFRFHNGQNYFDGSHKVRMSCEYEVVAVGIAPQARFLSNIPTSLYSWWINETIEGRMFYQNVDSIPDVTTRVSLKEQGIRSIAVLPYFSKSGKLIALIGLDWVVRPANLFEVMRSQGRDDEEFNYSNQKILFRNAVNGIGNLLDE